MEGTTDFDHHVTNSGDKETTDVFEDTKAFDTTIDMFNKHTTTGFSRIRRFLLISECPSSGFFGCHFDCKSFYCKTKKTEILQQKTSLWQWIGSFVNNRLIMAIPKYGWLYLWVIQRFI